MHRYLVIACALVASSEPWLAGQKLRSQVPAQTSSASVSTERSHVYRVFVGSSARRVALLETFDVLGACSCHVDLASLGPAKTVDVVVWGEERQRLLRVFPDARLVDRGRPFRDVARERARVAPQSPPDSNYYTVAEIESELLALERSYPKLAKRVDLMAFTQSAKTHEGRSIWALKISENVQVEEDEPQTLLASQHHARELNSPHMVLRAAQRVLAGYATNATIKKAVGGGAIWFVPTVNPDGVDAVWNVDRYWRKNRRKINNVVRGVDLNRNYPFRWGVCGASSNTSSQTYKGPAAGSEPETQVMIALARKLRFEKYLDFHSSGQEILDTYSPCTSVDYPNSKLLALHVAFRDRLASAMRYRTRKPSASGEAQEWHWAENGSMSFLVEVGRSFQPVFTETVAEEARVWPGVLQFLSWTPSVRGHVRSLRAKQGLEATLESKDFAFKHGERARTATSGRMHLWLSEGSNQVSITAPAHEAQTATVRAPAIGTTVEVDPVLIPQLPPIAVSAPSTMRVGFSTSIGLDATEAGKAYWIAMSLATTPGLPIGPRTLPLRPDGVFWLSTSPQPGLLVGQLGTTDASGKASARFSFPNAPVFVGFRFWFAGMTFEQGWPFDVKAISTAVPLTLTS